MPADWLASLCLIFLIFVYAKNTATCMNNVMYFSSICFGEVKLPGEAAILLKTCQMLLLLQLLPSDNHSKGRLHISNNQLISHTLPWQPGQRLAAVTVSCAADGCRNGQLTLWSNPSPGNKRQPCSISPYARGFSRSLGTTQEEAIGLRICPPPDPTPLQSASKQSFIVPFTSL